LLNFDLKSSCVVFWLLRDTQRVLRRSCRR